MGNDGKAKAPYKLRQKVEAVTRVFGGETVEEVAAALDIDATLIGKWHRTFRSAGRNALRYTADPDEIPDLRGVVDSAQKAFPARLVGTAESAACFFVAQFYGKNDVVHLYNLGMRDVTLVDLDEEKLARMGEIFPAEWTTIVADAFARAGRYHSEGRSFDLVVCDPYSNLASRVAWEEFDLFWEIADRFLCLLYTGEMFETLDIEPEATALGTALTSKLNRPVTCLDVVRRSTHNRGIFWATFAGRRWRASPGRDAPAG